MKWQTPVSKYYIKLDDLAEERKIDPNKFRKGLMAHEMRVPEVNEDIISLGLKCARVLLSITKKPPKNGGFRYLSLVLLNALGLYPAGGSWARARSGVPNQFR